MIWLYRGHRFHKPQTLLGDLHTLESDRMGLALWLGGGGDVRIAGCELVGGLSVGYLLGARPS